MSCAANNPKIRVVGRADKTDPLHPVLTWSGATFSIAFIGTDVKIHLQGSGAYYDVFVDGATTPTVLDLSTDASELHPLLTAPLASGPHTVTVFKRTEAQYGDATFGGFDIAGTIADLPAAPPHKIEFIGNSITCGYGVYGLSNSEHFLLSTEDHYYSYTSVAARSLNAEHHTVCYSGRGIYRNNDNSTTGLLPELFPLLAPGGGTWDFTQWTPDAVAINLGTNDFAQAPAPDSTGYVNATINFVKQIHTAYPASSVFLVDGPMLSDYYPPGVPAQSMNARYLNAARTSLISQGLSKVYRVAFPAQTGSVGYGSDWHPNVAQDAIDAALLTTAMKTSMGW